MTANVIVRRLGCSTAKLYQALVRILGESENEPSSAAIRSLLMDVLCGAYHDYRSGLVLPKGDLIESMRAVPSHASVDDALALLITQVVCGDFVESDDESRRWASRFADGTNRSASNRKPRPRPIPIIELTYREQRVHAWLYRYVEVYGASPSLRDAEEGIGMRSTTVSNVLQSIQRKGAAVNLGGKRGWLPTRAP